MIYEKVIDMMAVARLEKKQISKQTLKQTYKQTQTNKYTHIQTRSLNDFNSLLCLTTSLDLHAVYRLKFTRSGISEKSTKTFDQLKEMMNRERNFRNYRAQLKEATGPVVPYM